jgi:hypothetical protein
MKKVLCILLVVVVFLALIAGYVFSNRSPETAIRKHLLMIDPYQALTCSVQPTALFDHEKGMMFIISGFYDHWGLRINTAYVKANDIGLYYVYSLGGSPVIGQYGEGQLEN